MNTELIMWCLLSKHIPIIPAFGETPSGQILAVDMWSVTEKLSSALQPLKVIKVNTCGGFVDETGSVRNLFFVLISTYGSSTLSWTHIQLCVMSDVVNCL